MAPRTDTALEAAVWLQRKLVSLTLAVLGLAASYVPAFRVAAHGAYGLAGRPELPHPAVHAPPTAELPSP